MLLRVPVRLTSSYASGTLPGWLAIAGSRKLDELSPVLLARPSGSTMTTGGRMKCLWAVDSKSAGIGAGARVFGCRTGECGRREADRRPQELGDAGRRHVQPALQQAHADQRPERGQDAGGVDVLDRRAARTRGLAARAERHDVRAYAVSQQGVRHRSRHAEDQVALRAQAGRGGHSADVLRHRVSGTRLRGEQDLPAAGRQHAGCAGCRHRQGDLVGEERRSEGRRRQHQRAARVQGQGDHRHFRR